jgi:hypothetical protein
MPDRCAGDLPLRPAVFFLAAAATLAGCSMLVDQKVVQCRTDADCLGFDGYPACGPDGVCVPSGLGPAGCIYGPPRTPADFANTCSTAQCIPFNNCMRLGLCEPGIALNALVPPSDLGAPPPLVNTQPIPTIPCADPSRPNVIYSTGSTNFLPLLQAVAPLLAANEPPYVVVFQPQTSCLGVRSMFDSDPNRRVLRDIPNNWAFFYDASGSKNYCRLSPEGNAVDVGESDIYARTCGFEPKVGVADYLGPIQAITFVVPAVSAERSISAEAAHLLFGAGGNRGAIPPWTDPRLYFVRSAGTGTIQLASRAINVPPSSWWGIDRLSSDNLRDSMEVVDPTVAERAIGVLSSDFADKARANLRVLNFQGVGQACGYLPDSSPTSFDKANVRDGHYPIWGPIHLFAATSNGVPSAAADALVRRFAVPRLDQKLIDAIVTSGYIPNCAMRVRRDQEMGPLMSYQPQFGCGCYFDLRTTGRSSCTPCTTATDCPTQRPACNYGFCEMQ